MSRDKLVVDSLLYLLTRRGTIGFRDYKTPCPVCRDTNPNNQRKTHADWVDGTAMCTFECKKCRRVFVFRYIISYSNEDYKNGKSSWTFDREFIDASGTTN